MKEIISVYSTHMSKSTAVKKCAGHFQSGREPLGDNVKVGRPATVCNMRNVEKVKREIEKDRRKLSRDVANRTNILCCISVHKILRQNLEVEKVSSINMFILKLL